MPSPAVVRSQPSRGKFSPTQVSALKAWQRLAASAQSAGEWTSIVDVLNPGSPMANADPDRLPAVGASANGFQTMVFDGTDVLLWPQSPGHSFTTKLGIMRWFKPASLVGLQRLYSVAAGVAGSGSNRIQFYTNGSSLMCEAYINNVDGRSFQTASGVLTAGSWSNIYMQYDSSRGGDANMAIFVGGVSLPLTPVNIGAGGTLTVLQAATGSAVIGAGTDSDTPVQAIANGGELGPNGFAWDDNLTARQLANFVAFEAPT